MFESITSESGRGQVGIGTLIVFIAMVLVAAIAAGVLINTAGSLQSQASDTGTETQQAVANQIEVTHAVVEDMQDGTTIAGETATSTYTSGQFDELRLTVKKSAGSDVIDLTSMTVQYTNSDVSETLAHAGQIDDQTEAHFATDTVTSGTNDDSLTDTDDRINIVIPLNNAEGQPGPLTEGDSVSIELVDQSGAKFSYGVTMPQTTSDSQTVVQV